MYRPTNSQNDRFLNIIMRQSALHNACDFIVKEFKPEQLFTTEQLMAAVRRIGVTPENLYTFEEIAIAAKLVPLPKEF